MIRAYAQAVWDRFKADGTALVCIPSLGDRRAFLRVAEALPAGAGSDEGGDEGENWEFKGMVSVDEAAAAGARGKLRELQRICKNGGEAVPTTVVEVIELARDVVGTKRDCAAWVRTHSGILEELDSSQAAERLGRKDRETSNAQLTTLRARLVVVLASLEKVEKVLEGVA